MTAVGFVFPQLAIQFADRNARIPAVVIADPLQFLFGVGIGVQYAVCGTCSAMIPLFRHRRGSCALGRLLRCDTAGRRKKCPLFADKFSLRAILFPKGVDNSAFLWYNHSW